jgi:hypothetical protein
MLHNHKFDDKEVVRHTKLVSNVPNTIGHESWILVEKWRELHKDRHADLGICPVFLGEICHLPQRVKLLL